MLLAYKKLCILQVSLLIVFLCVHFLMDILSFFPEFLLLVLLLLEYFSPTPERNLEKYGFYLMTLATVVFFISTII